MITLLDGTQHEEKEILEKMQDDSFYYGYLSKAALSSPSLKGCDSGLPYFVTL